VSTRVLLVDELLPLRVARPLFGGEELLEVGEGGVGGRHDPIYARDRRELLAWNRSPYESAQV